MAAMAPVAETQWAATAVATLAEMTLMRVLTAAPDGSLLPLVAAVGRLQSGGPPGERVLLDNVGDMASMQQQVGFPSDEQTA